VADVDEFDAVVVGARCAGAPLATLLARRGLRVCLVDRATFPSETPSTHVLQPCGVLVLRELGVLQALWDAGAAPLERFTLVIDDVRMEDSFDRNDFGELGMCVRRVTLDAILVQAAIEAGVDVRTATNVSGLLREGGRVVGVETGGGEIRASLVVGADGQHSRVAELVGAQEYALAPANRFFAWGYFTGVPHDGRIRLSRQGDMAFLASPTDGGLFMAGVSPTLDTKADFLVDRDASYWTAMARWPELDAMLQGAEREGPMRIVSSWHGYFRRAAGSGWALIGDAGQFKDPTPGQGIADALRHARRMADVVAATYPDRAELDHGLQRWWRWRDRDSREMHWFAADLGAAGPVPPVRQRMIAALASTPRTTREFTRVLNHDIPPSKVFTSARLARAVVALGRERAVPMREVARETRGLLADNVKQARLDGPKPAVRRTRRPSAARASDWAKAAASASRS
jgi:2-polyprenyl-6-methoxyphenol hydroxylase-like FAD-dependent oxidoreductase